MKVLKFFFDFYINASIHVALAVVSFLKITSYYFNIYNDSKLELFVFFATITAYNFVKYAGVAKLHHRSLTKSLKAIQIFSLFCFLAMCFFGYQLTILTLLFTVPFGLLTLLYAVPFLSGFEKSLREISHLKILVVALVWTGFTVVLPVVNAQKSMSFDLLLHAVQRFLLTIVLILPFDIRDIKYDSISLQTIPQKIGVEKTKRLGVILLVIALVLEYLVSTTSNVKTPFLLFFFVTLILLMRSKINQTKYYSSFWVEAIPIFWWFLLLGFDNL